MPSSIILSIIAQPNLSSIALAFTFSFPNSTKSDVKYMLGLVPSYTQLGMASLLPNKEIRRDSKYKDNNSDSIIVDGISSVGTENRGKILANTIAESMAIQYDTLYEMTKSDWKKEFSGKKVVYI